MSFACTEGTACGYGPEVEWTYFPDNHPVEVRETAEAVQFCAPVEAVPPGTHLKKQLELRLDDTGTRVQVRHTITNFGDEPTELAVWAPTILRPGGTVILPFPPRVAMDKDHFRSVSPLTLWSFTDFTDSRWIFGQEFLQLKQDGEPSGRLAEQRSGLFNPAEWGHIIARVSSSSSTLPESRAGNIRIMAATLKFLPIRNFLSLRLLAPSFRYSLGKAPVIPSLGGYFRTSALVRVTTGFAKASYR